MKDVDELAKTLLEYMRMDMPAKKSDLIIGMGALDTRIAERSAQLFLEGYGDFIVFTGGLGKITKHTQTQTEAERFRDIAIEMGVQEDNILLEKEATNSGENIILVQKLLAKKGFAHVEFLLLAVVILAVVGAGYYVLKARTGGIFNSSAETTGTSNATKLAASSATAQTPVSEREYTFELQKDGRAVANGETVRGSVVVGVNMNVDRNLSNVKFLVDGVEVGSKQGIGLTGFRDFYTWATRSAANGQHTITVKATGSSGKEFELYSSATNTKSLAITVDNGSATKVPATGGTGGGSTAGGTTAPTTSEVTEKVRLSVSPGPLTGVSGSQAGTVNGQTITGGVVFTAKFKRPKSIAYDTKTMNVQVAKDGMTRLVMSKDSNSLDVKEEGDYKIYTFKRYYSTLNKPNGTSTWQAYVSANPAVNPDNDISEAISLTINNPDSTADATCKEMKAQVNDLFDRMTLQIDRNQKNIVEVKQATVKRYEDLGLASTNPIPDYDNQLTAFNVTNDKVDALQAELEALKIKCADAKNEDVGAKVVAFKTKLEEVKSNVSIMNAVTLGLLGDLRSRIPKDGGDNVSTPTGFETAKTLCSTFALPKDHRGIKVPPGTPNNNCAFLVYFDAVDQSENAAIGFSVASANTTVANPTLEQAVTADKQRITNKMNGNIDREVDTTVAGRPAKKIVFTTTGQIGTVHYIHYITTAPHTYAAVEAGEDLEGGIVMEFSTNIDTTITNGDKANIDKIIESWRWKPAPDFDIKLVTRDTPCFKFDIAKLNKIEVDDYNGPCATNVYYQLRRTATDYRGGIFFDDYRTYKSNLDLRGNVDRYKASGSIRGDTYGPEKPITVGGQAGIAFSESRIEQLATGGTGTTRYNNYFIQAPKTYDNNNKPFNGVVLFYAEDANNPNVNTYRKTMMEKALASWEWK